MSVVCFLIWSKSGGQQPNDGINDLIARKFLFVVHPAGAAGQC